jgi:serine/threonine protein kinase
MLPEGDRNCPSCDTPNPPRTKHCASCNLFLLIQDRFEVYDTIGTGGMGTVFRAWDLVNRCDVVVKFPIARRREEESRLIDEQRFRRETEFGLKTTKCRHLVHTIARPKAGERLYLVQSLAPGDTLLVELLRIEHGRDEYSFAKRFSLIVGIARALAEFHRLNLSHRDIKPENLLASFQGELARVTLIDFGLARGWADISVTADGEVVGTPKYMAPELHLGRAYSHASDVYSAALVMFQILENGRLPFDYNSVTALPDGRAQREQLRDLKMSLEYCRLRTAKKLGAPDQVLAQLERLVNRCLDKDPDRRPQSGWELLEELEQIQRAYEDGVWSAKLQAGPPSPEQLLGLFDALAGECDWGKSRAALAEALSSESQEGRADAQLREENERLQSELERIRASDLERLRQETQLLRELLREPAKLYSAAESGLEVRKIMEEAAQLLSEDPQADLELTPDVVSREPSAPRFSRGRCACGGIRHFEDLVKAIFPGDLPMGDRQWRVLLETAGDVIVCHAHLTGFGRSRRLRLSALQAET